MKKILLIAVAILGTLGTQAQTKINGVTVEKNLTVEGEELMLNGAGMREKLWYDLYVGALYLKNKTEDGEKLLKSEETMAIVLDITDEKVTQEAMTDAVNDGFEDSCTDKERAAIKSKIAKFIGMLNEPIKQGDHFEFVYKSGKGTMVSKNGKNLGTIEGNDFKKGFFGIWLGEDPADSDLKEAMLDQ
ncbi:MAG: chalcone isomerase family protein [Nonlabens sp.]